MIELDPYRSAPRGVFAWSDGDLAVHPYFGIVRITGHRAVDGTMNVAIEPVRVVRDLTVSVLPLSGPGAYLAPLVTRDEASRLIALLETPQRSLPPGQRAARLERCARTLTLGETPRMRLALHQLYSESFRPAARDLEVMGQLESIVLGELAIASGQSFESVRDRIRATSARFAADAPAPPKKATEEARFELREGQARAWGGVEAAHSKHIDLDVRPGWWRSATKVRGFEEYYGVAIHEDLRASLAHWLLKAKRIETSYTETTTALVESALDADDPAHVSEHIDPIDETIYGEGVWWSTGRERLFDVVAAYDGQLAVLIAARRRP